MIKNPLREGPIAIQRPASANHSKGVLVPIVAQTTLITRHSDTFLALHQEAYVAASVHHEVRAAALLRRNRQKLAYLHQRTSLLLTAYAQAHEIERLPLIQRPGPIGRTSLPGVHPAMITFAEGAAEEFFRVYQDPLASEQPVEPTAESLTQLMLAFRNANFHSIYLARLFELDAVMRDPSAGPAAEMTLLRRYGPHDM